MILSFLKQLRLRLRVLAMQARRTSYGPVNVAQGIWADAVDWFNGLDLSENSILIGFAAVIGLAAAIGVIGFYKLIDVAHQLFFAWPESLLPDLGRLAYRPLITGAGAVAAWALMRRFGRGSDGMNIPDVQLAVVRRQGHLPTAPALARTAASAVTIGSGGSAGSEGPVAVFGAWLASRLSSAFRFSGRRTGILVGAGAAAGISAAFNAPLAGAFFALEEILGSFSTVAFAPVVVSSVLAAMVSRAVFGNHPVFPVPLELGYRLTVEVVVLYPLLGLLCGLVSVFFVRCYFGVDAWTRRARIAPVYLAAAGGILVGALTFLSRGLLVGVGHLAIPLDQFHHLAWYLVLLLAAALAEEIGAAFPPDVVEVLRGHMVLEVRPGGIHKGLVVRNVRRIAGPGPILVALGDDTTDNDMFEALGPDDLAIRIGPGASAAHLRLRDVAECREMLSGMLAPAHQQPETDRKLISLRAG